MSREHQIKSYKTHMSQRKTIHQD